MAAMSGGASSVTGDPAPRVTRFAPSPTGELHLGNARTALFNLLLARHGGGRFLLRIEDTDVERSREAHTSALLGELRWLGIEWDAGPDREDDHGPYRQSQRGEIYARYLAALEERQAVYPCFCTPLELELSRRAQLAAGKPPRYAGTCRELSVAQRAARAAQGSATLRFRMPHASTSWTSCAARRVSAATTSATSWCGAPTAAGRFSSAMRWTMPAWASRMPCAARTT
jgi:glutamyl-tRNA synthetase